MSSLTGSSISGTYNQLLTVPSHSGSTGGTLVPITDGDGSTTFALKMATDKVDIQGGLTVGVDDTGYDVKFFGATATNGFMHWDENIDTLVLGTASKLCLGLTSAATTLHVNSSNVTTAAFGEIADEPKYIDVVTGNYQDRYAGVLFSKVFSNSQSSTTSFAAVRGKIDSADGAGTLTGRLELLYNEGNDLDIGMTITSTGKAAIGYEEPAPDAQLTVNQGADDGACITLKSSDIVHGLTTYAETDTYGMLKKSNGTDGGLGIYGFAENTAIQYGLVLESWGGTADTAKSTSGKGLILCSATEHDNADGLDNTAANGNIFAIRARQSGATVTRFIFDAEGDLHSDSSNTTFDSYDDAHLVRSFDLSHGRGVIDSQFDKFVNYNHEKLAELKLVGREEDGTPNHFINVTGMQRLHNGAIWQQYEEHQKLLNAFVKLAEKTVGLEEARALIEDNEIKKLGEV